MSSVDNRVVEMQFENKQFESGVAKTLSSVKKLKEGLNFKDSAESLKNLGSVSKSVDMSNLIGAVESIKDRFSTLGIIGMTVLQNIANKAISVGSTLTKSLTLQPIMDGFTEYETQMNSIQTILSNTRSEGTNIQQVNAALDELNHYADQTIYNFTEMTRNIGTFTAAGVDLNTSVNAIQGIANLAAVSGSNSQQASTAMYQLSQALATGTVKLMDWNSVVNAGMGGQVFQDALKETSKELGTGAEAAIKANGSFRESLQTGWLTSKVLTETLKKFTTSGAMEWVANYCDVSKDAVQSAYDQAYANSKATDTIGKQKDAIDGCAEALAKQTGKSKDAIKETLSLAYDAQDAATKVKTFSQLIDTLKEALGSGWTKSWQIMIGDFEEAREMWTNVSVVLSDMINKSADARNALLQDWANLGGRKAIIDGIATAFNNIVSVAGAVKKAFREVFPPVTAQQLVNISNGFKTLMENMKPTEDSLNKISRIAKGFFSGLDLIKKGLMSVLGPIGNFVGANGLGGLATSLLDVLASVGDFVTSLDEAADKGKFFETISSTLAIGLNGLKTVLDNIGGGFDNFTGKINTIAGKFKDFISSAIEPLKNTLTWLKENISLNDIFSGLIAGSIVKAFSNIAGVFQKIQDAIDDFTGDGGEKVKGIKESITDLLGTLGDTLQTFQTQVKATSLLEIAAAVTLLVSSLDTLSDLDAGQAISGVAVIGVLMKELNMSLRSISGMDSKGVIKSAAAMILVAKAVNTLSKAIASIGSLSFSQIVKGLGGVSASLFGLSKAAQAIGKTKVSLKSSIAVLALAEACKILSNAIEKIGSMNFKSIVKGVGGIGIVLTELVGATVILDKFTGGKGAVTGAAAVLILAQALSKIGPALESVGNLSWDQIGKGLTGIGLALVEMTAVIAVLSNTTGIDGGITSAASILILALALKPIGDELTALSGLSWDQIKTGLAAMGGALAELVIALSVAGISGLSGLIGAISIDVVAFGLQSIADALLTFGSMSWDQVKTGLVSMGGALAELVAVLSIAGLSGLSGVVGAIGIDLIASQMGTLADALVKFGSMSWDQVKTGLVSMGGALAELVIATGTEGLMGVSAALGAISIDAIVSQLDSLANALIKFGSMSWDDISRGLTSMMGALSETALGGLINTFSGFGAGAISEMAEPLGTLADSVKKWSGVTVPDGLADQLGQLADGVGKFWASGWGAGAISEVAEPLGTLASSVSKWSSVVVPENIGTGLSSLASGVNAFTFSGMAGGSISSVAEPLGTLAKSVKKWSDVTIPDGLQAGLQGLATGVNSFTFSGLAGGGIASVAEPLGNLAKSVKKWNGVEVPEDIQGMLQRLASGVNSFTFSGFAGGGISEIVEPLKSLAGAVTAWSGVTIPEGIGTGLSSLAAGINAFSTAQTSAGTLSTAASGLRTMAGAVTTLGSTDLSGVAAKIKEFASALKNVPASLSGTAEGVGTSLQTVANAITSNSALISNAFTTVLNSATTAITNSAGSFTTAANTITQGFATALTNGLSNQQGAATTAVKSIMVAMRNQATSSGAASRTNFENAGKAMTTALKRGIDNGKSSCVTAVRNVVNSCKSAVDSGSFYNIGLNLAQGMANGINAGAYKAINAAAAMGAKAVKATKDATGEKSPSRFTRQIGVFFDQGLINGIIALKKKVGMTAASVGDIAVAKMQDSMSGATATLTPVIDSNNVLASMSNKRFKVDTRFVGNITNPMSNMQSAIEQSNLETMKSNTKVLDAINELNDNLGSYADAVANSETAMYVDGKKLASSIAKPMNQQLGILSRRGGLA
jgi:tape measure domain-containing protein